MCYYRTDDGMCRKFTDDKYTSYCVDGPCPHDTPTNADKIRGMSDEELQKFLHEFESGAIDYAKTFCDLCCKDAALERRSVDCEGCLLWWLKNDAKQPQGLDCWTKQPAETEGTE